MHFRQLMTGAAIAAAMGSAQAVTVFSEGFDSVPALAAAGWVQTNNSDTPTQPWSQGNSGVFASFAGAGNSYAAASFLSSGSDTGNVSNWLITPIVSLTSGATLSFYARTDSALYADGLNIRLSPTGSAATADFATTLLALPSLNTSWTQYTVALPAFASATSVRIAFEYKLANATNADYIGLDSVAVNVAAIPEPTSAALLGFGIAGLLIRRRVAA